MDERPPPPARPGQDRARRSSPDVLSQPVDRETEERIAFYARRSRADLSRRIAELEQEWDLERLLELQAATLGLLGLLLGIQGSRRWLLLPALAAGFLLQHGLGGWSPPVPLMRWLKVRSRREIDFEKYALLAVRGDLERFKPTPSSSWAH